jgi:competence protein ComEA
MSFVSGFSEFTRSERRGVVVLSTVIIILVILNQLAVSDHLFSTPNDPETPEKLALLMANADSLEDRYEYTDRGKDQYKERKYSPRRKEYRSMKRKWQNDASKVEYFEFDPNTLDEEGWQALGFSEKQAKAMVKFIQKSGPFTKSDDLLKMFAIDTAKYLELKDYLVFNEVTNSDREVVYWSVADGAEEDLRKLPGVNMYMAERIVKYRESLGGYISEEQILEVKGMRPTLLDSIRSNLNNEWGVYRQININTADPVELKKHPYCNDWKIARLITDTRDRFGPYKSIDELLRLPGIDKDWYFRIKPYLTIKEE